MLRKVKIMIKYIKHNPENPKSSGFFCDECGVRVSCRLQGFCKECIHQDCKYGQNYIKFIENERNESKTT